MNGTCSIDGCDGNLAARGWCNKHWLRWRRNGGPQTVLKVSAYAGQDCSIEDCTDLAYSRGWCRKHYCRWQAHGDPRVMTRGSAGDGWITPKGYRAIPCTGHPIARADGSAFEHRVVLWDAIGPGPHPCHWCGIRVAWKVDLEVDHLDADRLNNSRENLVPACHPCNSKRRHAGNPIDWSPFVQREYDDRPEVVR